MKKLSCFILLILFSYNSFCQNTTSNYTDWQTVYTKNINDADYTVQIRFKLAFCGNDGYLKGNSKYETKNNFAIDDAYLTFKFDHVDCTGKVATENLTVFMDKPKLDADIGNWFLGYKVINVYDIKVIGFVNVEKQSPKVTNVEGLTIEEVGDDNKTVEIELNKRYKKNVKPLIDKAPKRPQKVIKSPYDETRPNAVGRRAENEKPKIPKPETLSITVEEDKPIKKKAKK